VTEFSAACHCGAVTARFQTSLAPEAWTVRACQCGFCRLHAAMTAADPAGSLSFTVTTDEALQRYRFAACTADFLLCRRCGVYVGAAADIGGARFGLLNTRTLRPLPELPMALAMNYDGESAQQRRARRAARWTPLLAESL
jgi:hypothetical protein